MSARSSEKGYQQGYSQMQLPVRHTFPVLLYWKLPKWFIKDRASAPLQARLAELEARQDRLEGQFATLQGYVYAKRGIVGPGAEAATAHGSAGARSAAAPSSAGGVTKDELRRQLVASGRIMPGKATKMSE
jgi:hypothetical protein